MSTLARAKKTKRWSAKPALTTLASPAYAAAHALRGADALGADSGDVEMKKMDHKEMRPPRPEVSRESCETQSQTRARCSWLNKVRECLLAIARWNVP